MGAMLQGELTRTAIRDVHARLDELAARMNVENHARDQLLGSEAGRAMFVRAVREYGATPESERRKLLADALLHGAARAPDHPESDRFMRMVMRLEVVHVRILAEFSPARLVGTPHEGKAPWAGRPEELSVLVAEGLLEAKTDFRGTVSGGGVTRIGPTDLPTRHALTPLGDRFLDFLTDDPDD